MKKKFLGLALTGLITLGLPVGASAAEIQNPKANTQVTSNSVVTPNWVYDKTVTVNKNYTSLSSIPNSLYYEEYSSALGWLRGTLSLTNIKISGSIYIATFTGTIYSNQI